MHRTLTTFTKCILLTLISLYAHATTYYIAASGNTTNNGTSTSTPWSLDKLNASWASILPGDNIFFLRGDNFNGGIVIGKSGTSTAKIVIGAYGSAAAKPVLNALVPVTGWVSKGNGIYESTTTTPVDLMMVLVNNKIYGQGRTPNTGSYYTSSTGGSATTVTSNMPTTVNWTGATLGARVSHWQIGRYQITAQSGSTLTIANGKQVVSGYGLWIMNDIRTLDQFGEWYRNPTTGKLSMFFGTASPSSYNVEMSTLNNIISSTSKSYVTIQDIALRGSNNNAVDINYGSDITLSRCDIDASGGSGVDTKDHTNVLIDASRVTRSLNNGLHLNMYSTGDNIKATNNYIDSSYFIEGMGGSGQQDGNGITLGRGGLIQGNVIKHTGYCGLRFQAFLCTMKNNYIDTFCFIKDDGGGIYTGGNNPFTATPKKSIIGNMLFHGIGAPKGTPDVDNRGEGIYMDDDANNIDILGNTVAYVSKGLFIHNNSTVQIHDNTFYSNLQNMYYKDDNLGEIHITGINATRNISFGLTTSNRVVYAANTTTGGSGGTMGIIDSNYYCRPIDETLTGKPLTWRESTEVNVNLAGWKTKYPNYDKATKATPKSITSTSEVLFLYNPTADWTTISLNGKTYIDPTSVPYTTGSITLGAYSSKILIITPNVPLSGGGTTNITPTVSMASPSKDSSITIGGTVTLRANASDPDNGILSVQFYNGTTLLGSAYAAPYTYVWTPAVSGSYQLTAKATDNSTATNKSSTSLPVMLTVVNKPANPTVSLTAPTTTSYTAPAIITLTATAAAATGRTLTKVEFFQNGTLLSTNTTAPYTKTWTGVAAGTYQLTATATDDLGVSTTSSPVTVTVSNPANTPSVISITSPVANQTFTAPATINISANATDAEGVKSVSFYRGGTTLIGTDTSSPYTYVWTGIAAGSYQISAVVTDKTGATTTSAPIDVTVNNPTVGAVVTGELKKWHKVTLTFDGPTSSETSTPNPFMDYRLNVTFTHTSGKTYTVPGYFAADGNAAESGATSGNKWRVHFAPDLTGTWNYSVSFRSGTNVAISDVATDGTAVTPDGTTGSIIIVASDKSGVDLRGKGRLDYTGNAYMKWAETGEYFRKTGTDAPENLLAFTDIDNVSNYNNYRKTYTPHVTDWRTGDPVWQTTKGKGLIGAINYLSSTGVNSISFLTMNIRGDDRNVWPYIDTTNRTRFDDSKLDQWGIIFDHAEKMGMHLHFKTQEVESWPVLGGDMTDQRKVYYHELIARFGYHLAMNWNLGEENTQTTTQQQAMAQYFYAHDPYHHNIVLHTYPTQISSIYTPLLGTASKLTGVSIQTDTANVYTETRRWVENSAAAGKKWIVANDEQGAAAIGVATDASYTGNRGTVADNSDQIRRTVLWGNLMAGGAGVEYYYGYSTGETDLTLQDFRSRDKSYGYAKIATTFFNTYFPFTETKPLSNVSTGWSLGKDSVIYAVYLKAGGTTNITLPVGNYTVKWYNPRTGGALTNGTISNIIGGTVSIGLPPSNTNLDWVALVQKSTISNPTVSLTAPANNTNYTAPATINLTATASDADGTIQRVDFYNGSTLLGKDTAAPYTFSWPNIGSGTYVLKAIATDNNNLTGTSNTATVTVGTVTPPANIAPTVEIDTPFNGATYIAPANIPLYATANDVDGTVDSVTFYQGNTKIFTEVITPWQRTWKNVPVGVYNLSAVAYDNLKKTGTSTKPVQVTVTNAPANPTVSLTSPTNGASFTAPGTINLSATAADRDGTVAKVDFFSTVNGVSTLIKSVTTAPYTFSWTAVAAGSYTISAKATDNTGLTGNSAAVTITVNAPANQFPSVGLTGPADQSIFQAPVNVTISANAADIDGTIASVAFYNGSTLLGTDVTSPYSYTLNSAAAGNYTITAVATDNSGAKTTSAARTFTVKKLNVAPRVALTSPINNATFSSPASVQLTATATDSDGIVSHVMFYQGTTLIQTVDTVPYTFLWTPPAGTYALTAVALDDLGASTTSSVVNITVKSPVAPNVSISTPSTNLVSPATITASATAADPDGTIAKVEFFQNGVLVGTDLAAPYSYSIDNQPAGIYNIYAKATDNSGLSTASTSTIITVTNPQTAPQVSITSPPNNTTLVDPTEIVINASASDLDGTIARVQFYNGTTLIGEDTLAPYSLTWSGVTRGVYTVTAKAIDNDGLSTTSSPITITVNHVNVAPTIYFISPGQGDVAPNKGGFVLNAGAYDTDGSITKVQFFMNGKPLATVTTVPYTVTVSGLNAGLYTFTAIATDDGGLTATAEVTTKVLLTKYIPVYGMQAIIVP